MVSLPTAHAISASLLTSLILTMSSISDPQFFLGSGVGSLPFVVGAAVAGARVGRPVGQIHAQAGVVDVQPVVGFGVGPDGSAVGHSAGPSSDSSVADRVKIDSVVVCHVFPAVRAGVRHAVDGAKV